MALVCNSKQFLAISNLFLRDRGSGPVRLTTGRNQTSALRQGLGDLDTRHSAAAATDLLSGRFCRLTSAQGSPQPRRSNPRNNRPREAAIRWKPRKISGESFNPVTPVLDFSQEFS